MKKVKYFGLVLFTILVLNACTKDDGSQSSSVTISLSGTAVDGYISDATVCLDINTDGICGSTEPSTTTDINGIFNFTDVEVLNNVLIPVIVVGGTDTATGEQFVGELKNIVNSATITAETSFRITPLTDLIATSFLLSTDKNLKAFNDSRVEILKVFNLSLENLISDPMTNIAVFAKTQEVQQIKALLEIVVIKATIGELTDSKLPKLRNEITRSIVKQIKKSTAFILDVNEVLTEVETSSNVIIPQNQKIFIAAQMADIKKALDNLVSDTNADINTLDKFQAGLESEQKVARNNLIYSIKDEIIKVVTTSDTTTLIKNGGYVQNSKKIESTPVINQNSLGELEVPPAPLAI